MRFIVPLTVMFAVSVSALPRFASFASERDLTQIARKAGGNQKENGTDSTDLQDSLTLASNLVNTNFEQNGMSANSTSQVPSLTSRNNFINFCATVKKPLTNGQQIKNGSCNATPMGVVAPAANIPSSKFIHPKNFDTVKANTQFEIRMAIKHLDAGHFTNPDKNYFAAPQQLNAQDDVMGHTHFVIESLPAIDSTDPLDPSKFKFFKGVDTPQDAKGVVSVPVPGGLPEGIFRISSMATSSNHVPVAVAVAQHGHVDDQVYFFVNKDGKASKNVLGNGN